MCCGWALISFELQILSFQWIPAAVVCLLRFWLRPGVRTSLWFVLAFVAQALVSWYLAVMVTTVVVIVALLRPTSETCRPPLLKYYALIAGAIVLCVAPFAMVYRAGFADSTLAARSALVDTFGDAVRLADYLTPPSATLAGARIAGNNYGIWGENTLYIGVVPLILAAIGLLTARRWALIGAALVGTGYILALGYVSPSLGLSLPLHYLARWVPTVAGLRATQRFSLVLYAGILVLSSLGLARMIRTWSARWQAAATAVVAIFFLVFAYQLGTYFYRNRPGRYRPDAVPRDVLPKT